MSAWLKRQILVTTVAPPVLPKRGTHNKVLLQVGWTLKDRLQNKQQHEWK